MQSDILRMYLEQPCNRNSEHPMYSVPESRDPNYIRYITTIRIQCADVTDNIVLYIGIVYIEICTIIFIYACINHRNESVRYSRDTIILIVYSLMACSNLKTFDLQSRLSRQD